MTCPCAIAVLIFTVHVHVYVTGYGDTWSILSVNQHTALPGLPAVQHSGYIYTCNIDLPGVPGVFIESVWISGTSVCRTNSC